MTVKFVKPNKRLLVVAIAAGLVGLLPMFVVLAAQGQITEVNPSGVSGVTGIVTIPNLVEPDKPTVLTVTANTSWKVVGKDQTLNVLARFDFSASDNADGDGSPDFACSGIGSSLTGLTGLVTACLEKLDGPNNDLLPQELEDMITKFGQAAHDGLMAIGIDEATLTLNQDTTAH